MQAKGRVAKDISIHSNRPIVVGFETVQHNVSYQF